MNAYPHAKPILANQSVDSWHNPCSQQYCKQEGTARRAATFWLGHWPCTSPTVEILAIPRTTILSQWESDHARTLGGDVDPCARDQMEAVSLCLERDWGSIRSF